MYRVRSIKNEGGYTLVESILHLAIFALFAQLFLMFFYWKAPIERYYTDHHTVAWEMFSADLQDELAIIDTLKVQNNGEGISFQTTRGRISIQRINQVIRKTVDGQGHVPLLTDISSVQFMINHPNLTVRVTMRDGTRKERDFTIGDYTQ